MAKSTLSLRKEKLVYLSISKATVLLSLYFPVCVLSPLKKQMLSTGKSCMCENIFSTLVFVNICFGCEIKLIINYSLPHLWRPYSI